MSICHIIHTAIESRRFNACKSVISVKGLKAYAESYTAITSKNCSTEKFPNLDLVLYNSQVAKYQN